MHVKLLSTVVLSLAIAAGSAAAQQSGGVTLRGNTRVDAHATDVNTMALGSHNSAVTNIGAITEDTRGNTAVSVDVKNVQNIVSGRGHKGCVSIGSQGKCQ